MDDLDEEAVPVRIIDSDRGWIFVGTGGSRGGRVPPPPREERTVEFSIAPDELDAAGEGGDSEDACEEDPWTSPAWVNAVVFSGWLFALFVLAYCVTCVPLAEALGAADRAGVALARLRSAAAGPTRSALGIYEGASRIAAALFETVPAASSFRTRLERWMSEGSDRVGWLSESALRAARASVDFISDERPLRYKFSVSPGH